MIIRTKMKTGSKQDAHPAVYGSPGKDMVRRLLKNKAAVAGLLVFAVIVVSCIIAPLLTKYHYAAMNTDNVKAKPSSAHILGTDYLGRDMFTRMLYGGRVTLRISFVSTTLAAVFGSIIGLISGYFGKRTDLIFSYIGIIILHL